MPKLVGFSRFAALLEEQISEKVSRRILSGDQGMISRSRRRIGRRDLARRRTISAAESHPNSSRVQRSVRGQSLSSANVYSPKPSQTPWKV